jgi:thiol:disulfide interchange protein DsbD
MRLFQYLLLILCLASANVFAQESGSFNLFSKLQGLGINLGQSNQQELLPPDEAFKLSVEVRDGNTLIANLTPAKDYYLYRDKIVFESKQSGMVIEKITLPPGKMKEDMTFGQTEVYYNPIQAIITLKREDPASEQPLTLSATYRCNEPVGCYAPIHKAIDLTLPAVKERSVLLLKRRAVKHLQRVDATAGVSGAVRAPAIETKRTKLI